MPRCLIVQPIHPAGVQCLEDAGVEAVFASAPDMAVVIDEIAGAHALITRNAGLSRQAMEAAPELRVIGNHGIGTDRIDTQAAETLGLPIVFTPYGNMQSVAEHAIALMLAVARLVPAADRSVRSGNRQFRYRHSFQELAQKRLGIVGFGRIGRRTAEIARTAFDMEILVHAPSLQANVVAAAGACKIDDLRELMAQADVVSLHLPLRPSTRGLIDAAAMDRLREHAILVNTSRGGVIDEPALLELLKYGRIAGAGLDVLVDDPVPSNSPFLDFDNVVLAPHLGGTTEQALERTALQVAAQVIDVLAGRTPPHLVNPDMWQHRRHATSPPLLDAARRVST